MERFWSLKQHVQSWLDENNIINVKPFGLGKGCRGVELYFFEDQTSSEFIKKYPMLETNFYKGYFTPDRFGKVYISMVKKK